ncbi:MAG TPA: hypothetical protein DCG51_04010 [Erysipelotrichaceae bacterium]|jgi:hypothetical protein|nr:hypothetical protein [Solobacterium sp.]HAE15695.1 hypothetical protein [Erysipelotrichaceae bacterium]
MNFIYAILIGAALGALNIFLLKKNRETPVPEGCEDLSPDCSACGIADCALREHYLNQKGENNQNA